MDKLGRVLIPKPMREHLEVEEFEVSIVDGGLVLRPVKDPLELFGTLKGEKDSEFLSRLHGEEHEDPT